MNYQSLTFKMMPKFLTDKQVTEINREGWLASRETFLRLTAEALCRGEARLAKEYGAISAKIKEIVSNVKSNT